MQLRVRFAALLAVLLVIGIAGVAWGGNGDPLILGQENEASVGTSLAGSLNITGQVFVRGPLISGDIQGGLRPWCGGTVTIPSGVAKASSRFTAGDCNGLALVASINGTPPKGIWVTGVRNLHPRDQPWIEVYLNAKTPVPLTVAFMGFTPAIVP
jgi:hypothetical protein